MNDKALEWLRQWESMINAADFAGARRLFSPDVISYGTLTGFMAGFQELETRQWRKVWPTVKDFKFDDPLILLTGKTLLQPLSFRFGIQKVRPLTAAGTIEKAAQPWC